MKEKSRKQEIAEALIGLTYRDYEELFENVVAPISMVGLQKAVEITKNFHKNIKK